MRHERQMKHEKHERQMKHEKHERQMKHEKQVQHDDLVQVIVEVVEVDQLMQVE